MAPFVIAISGNAKSGKDTLCNILKKRLQSGGYNVIRAALADPLKEQIKPFLLEKYGIDILNCSPEQKEEVRHELVAFGKLKRQESDKTYWWKLLEELHFENGHDIILCPDLRYKQGLLDEYEWLRWNEGYLIHVTRFYTENKQNIFIEPANHDEEVNNDLLLDNSDFSLVWETAGLDELEIKYKSILDNLTDLLLQKCKQHKHKTSQAT